MSLRERGKQQRRERIINAAIELLRQGGLNELSTAKIADKAEVSVATLYNLIGSMDDIFDHPREIPFRRRYANSRTR